MKLRLLRLVLFVILLGLVSSIVFFSLKNEKDEIKKVADVVTNYFDKSLQYEKVNLLSLALALSENCELKNAINSDDEEIGHEILSKLSLKFKKYTNMQDMKIQVVTSDHFLFARSWESGFSGVPLWWFRDDMDDIIKTQEPKSGIELGMMLTLRSTVPIWIGKEVIGYIESIKLLDELANSLRTNGIELFVLMNQEYLQEASLMRENSQIGDFVLSNMNASKKYFQHLKTLPWKELESEHMLYDKDILFTHQPMYNSRGKKLGVFILAIPPETYTKITSQKNQYIFMQDFSNQDLSSVVKSWEKPLGGFKEQSHREIVELLPKLHKEDSVEFKNRARNFLETYDKEALIDIILNSDTKMQKIGEIK